VVIGRRCRGDRGSVSVEMTALVFPVTIILAVLLVGVWRVTASDLDVQAAAASAARAASLQRNPSAAVNAARQAAEADLAHRDRTCAALTVSTDLGAFNRGGWVAVTVTCKIGTRDLVGLDAPGGATSTATARAPIETYRELQP
jgi:Flp pilus assembly protein TadG